MRYVLVARLRSYLEGQPVEERHWDFGTDRGLADDVHLQWASNMEDGLWEFRSWGFGSDRTLLKPGAIQELDLRAIRNPL